MLQAATTLYLIRSRQVCKQLFNEVLGASIRVGALTSRMFFINGQVLRSTVHCCWAREDNIFYIKFPHHLFICTSDNTVKSSIELYCKFCINSIHLQVPSASWQCQRNYFHSIREASDTIRLQPSKRRNVWHGKFCAENSSYTENINGEIKSTDKRSKPLSTIWKQLNVSNIRSKTKITC